MIPYWPLYRIVEKSELLIRGRVVRVEEEERADVEVLEVLKRAPTPEEIRIEAPPACFEAPPFAWRTDGEVVAALAGGGPPFAPVGGTYGLLDLGAAGGAGVLAAVRDMRDMGAAGERDDDLGSDALAALLRRPDPFSICAGLEALSDWPRARRCLGPAGVRAVVEVTRGRHAALRALASRIARTLPEKKALPALLERLADDDEGVRAAANDSLVSITGEDVGFAPDGPPDRRSIAIARWWRCVEARGRPKDGT